MKFNLARLNKVTGEFEYTPVNFEMFQNNVFVMHLIEKLPEFHNKTSLSGFVKSISIDHQQIFVKCFYQNSEHFLPENLILIPLTN